MGENPFEGLKRETKEEIGAEIEIITPLDVHFFTRDDGQQIQLTIFVCKLKTEEIVLSEEHTEYQWKSLSDPINEFPEKFQCCIRKFNQFEFSKYI